jgi:hypothetical protein
VCFTPVEVVGILLLRASISSLQATFRQADRQETACFFLASRRRPTIPLLCLSLASLARKQLGQLGNVGGDPACLVVPEHARLPRLILVSSEVRVGDRPPRGIFNAERLLKLAVGPGRRGGCSLSSRVPPHKPALLGVNPVNHP